MLINAPHLNTSLSPIVDITKSAFFKSTAFFTNVIQKKSFLESLNSAEITPNNIVTFRLALMVSGAVAYLLQKDIGAIAMTISCILDSVDGKLARNFNQKSKEGEIYDPFSDKISEVLLSFLSLFNLDQSQNIAQSLAIIARLYFHYQSQFNEARGSIGEQLEIIRSLILRGDKDITYIDSSTTGAANEAGKWKTILQLTSGLGIVWLDTHIVQEALSLFIQLGIPATLEEVTQFLTWIFIGAGGLSLPLAMISTQSKKKP